MHQDARVLVEPSQLEGFQQQLDRLNRKARRFGLEPIQIVDQAEQVFERKHEYLGRDQDRLMSYLVPVPKYRAVLDPVILVSISIRYPLIKLGDWTVVGKLERCETGILSFAVSSDEQDAAMLQRHAAGSLTCEHCGTRRGRKEAFLLRDGATGLHKLVGKQCVRDFTGHDPAALLFLAQMVSVVRLAEGELEDLFASARANEVETGQFLAAVSFLVERCGFVSAKIARDTGTPATYELACNIHDVIKNDPALLAAYENELPEHRAKAGLIRTWVANQVVGEDDFWRNARLLLQSEALGLKPRHLATAAATVPLYNGFVAEQAANRGHVGAVGQKLTTDLTIVRILGIMNRFSGKPEHLILLEDQTGNRIRWVTGAAPQEMVDGRGRRLSAQFTVKEHGEYKGIKQTSVVRLKVLKWSEEAS